MKTSELRINLRKFGEDFRENDICFEDNHAGWYIYKKELRIAIHSDISSALAKALIDYFSTPLKEREDEKKYIIKTSIPTMSDYVIYLNSEENEFILFPISQKFTQQEIDNFPTEIKGAIECGFLRKVEVE